MISRALRKSEERNIYISLWGTIKNFVSSLKRLTVYTFIFGAFPFLSHTYFLDCAMGAARSI